MTQTGQDKLMKWVLGVMATIIIGLISVMYSKNDDNFSDAKYERKEIKQDIKDMKVQLDQFIRNSITTSNNITSLTNRVEKNEEVIEKLRDK